jgi:hypothetical protein
VLEHEIKYLVPASAASSLIAWTASACLRDERYPPARVHTVYYDTPGLALLYEKIDSDYLKTKVRLRWYADRHGRAGALFAEAKFRVGSLRQKVRVRLTARGNHASTLPLHDRTWLDWLEALRAQSPPLPAALAPVLGLSYTRHRFSDAARGGARVTIDEGIALDRLNGSFIRGRIPGALPHSVFEYKGRRPDLPAAFAPVVRFGGRRGSWSKYLACYQHVARIAN